MDFHVLIVIACVFLASLFSLLFINKFFRGKTFEEVAAEKRLLAEKLYGPSKAKRQQRKIPSKKEIKKEKKQRQKETSSSKDAEVDSHNESDIQSDNQSIENSPTNKKPHVEFSEPEIITDDDTGRRLSTANDKHKTGKRKISTSKSSAGGILVNKSEPVLVKEVPVAEPLNNFETKQPKDVVEMKKSKDDAMDLKKDKDKTVNKDVKKSSKSMKKETEKPVEQQNSGVEEIPVIKEIKKVEEKHNKAHDSPKNQNKQKKEKKKLEQAGSILEKLDGSDVIGVYALMTLLSRAELNRSEIQMLIDYLLNRQQDTITNHSEWSDDIVQKLKKQIIEKDKALQEEQEASAGIQAKLRDLRAEINVDRIQFNASIKAYTDEIQAKKMEIHNLSQEFQNLTDKFNIERQQFQVKLLHEKQAASQELLAQIQQLNERNNLLQNEIVQKNSFINELQMIANASHQAVEETKANLNEIIQRQDGEIRALEQNLTEVEKTMNRQQYDLELAKMVEKDKESSKVEIRNLQNALDSTKAELTLARNEVEESKKRADVLSLQYDELKKQFTNVESLYQEHTKEKSELVNAVATYKSSVSEKEAQLAEYALSIKTLTNKEDELMKQIKEQKEKNNDLRTKNWKLVEALQNAEKNAFHVDKKQINNLVHQTESSSGKDEQKIRELFERLFPEATKSTASSALSLSLEQWLQQVVAAHLKQHIHLNNIQSNEISKHKNQEYSETKNQINNSSHNHQSSTESTANHNHNNISSNSDESNNNSNRNSSTNSNNDISAQEILLDNNRLRAQVKELTAIVTKTENMLINLETRAVEQDAHWRSVVQSKQEEINLLKNLNGEAI